MNCEIICVGTELLTGDTLNTNSQYIARELSKNGFSVHFQTTLGDNPGRLKDVFEAAVKRSDVVVVTGGLGPTQDDLTKETVAAFFGMSMQRDEAQVRKMKQHFDRRNYVMTDNNFRQCDIPVGAKAINNTQGTAPGIHIEKNGISVFLLPGPPSEMKAMFDLYVMSNLKNRTSQLVISRYFNICDFGESMVEEMILDLVNHQTNPTIATYAKLGEVLVRITANGTDAAAINGLLDKYSKEMDRRFGRHIFAHAQKTLAETVGDLLLKKHRTMATAESCTGGLIASQMTAIPGISEAFKMGVVTYSNEAKMRLLDVQKKTLDEVGAVSEKTAREMCEHLATLSECDVNVSVTGIAGPDGGSAEKPVGLVYVGVHADGWTRIEKCKFAGSRQTIQKRSVNKALCMVREAILNLQ